MFDGVFRQKACDYCFLDLAVGWSELVAEAAATSVPLHSASSANMSCTFSCMFLSFFLWNEKLSRNNGLWVSVQFTLLFLPLKPCGSTGKDYGINGQQQLQHSTHCLLKLLLSCSWLNVKGCNAVKSPNNERRPCSYGVVTGWPSPVVCACTRQNNVLNSL